MSGTMMHQQLTIGSMIDHAARYHAGTEVVSVETAGGLARTNWGEVGANARRLASALGKLGVTQGDRCATIAWNNHRHHELYWATANTGRICHTLNIRLFPDQLT